MDIIKHSTTKSRIDVHQLKSQLNIQLGERKELYWTAMKKYFSGKLSRSDLDIVAQQVLTRKFHNLHNQFIKAVHYNAQPQVPPPPHPLAHSNSLAELHMLNSYAQFDPHALKMFLQSHFNQQQLQSLLVSLRSSPQSSLAVNAKHQSRLFNNNVDYGNDELFPTINVHPGHLLPLSTETTSLPSIVQLKQRMMFICQLDGVRLISNNVVLYLSMAVEYHLKTILSRVVTKTRTSKIFPQLFHDGQLIRRNSVNGMLTTISPSSAGSRSHQLGGGDEGNNNDIRHSRNSDILKAKEEDGRKNITIRDLLFTLRMEKWLVGKCSYIVEDLSCAY